MQRTILRLLPVLAVLAALLVASPPPAQADMPTIIQIAIPNAVAVTVGQHTIVFIGRQTSVSPIACALGTPQPLTVVVAGKEGDSPSEITGVLAFHDHEIPLGSRFQITAGPNACSGDLRLYTATLIN